MGGNREGADIATVECYSDKLGQLCLELYSFRSTDSV